MKQFFLGAIALFLASCATTPYSEKKDTKVYLDKSNVLHYEGSLGSNANNILFSLYENANKKPSRLAVNSNGGDVMLGLDIGEWIVENKIDVAVSGVCASSCANYIFPAGRQKYLQKDSVLIWHGNSYQKDVDLQVRQGKKFALAFREREKYFYQSIKVNPKLGIYGHKEFNFWNSIYHYFKNTVGFDYSIADMKKFGITNINLDEGEWDWRKYRSKTNHNVVRVDVVEEYL